jgi:hypothetical protein
MAQKIVVQDGIIVYATSDPALSVNVDVRGQMNVTKELNVGDDPLADGTITTPPGADLLIAPGTGGNISLIPDSASILLNNVSWPDGTITPTSGMFIGVSGVNNLQFYSFIIASSLSNTLTQLQLNTAYPSIKVGQIVLGPSVIYYFVGSGNWRLISAPVIA